MQLDLDHAELRLARHAVVRLERGAARIVCRAGSVWVTRDHDRRDVVLTPGQVYENPEAARLIVSALENARIGIGRAGAARPVRAADARRAALAA